MHAQPFVDGDLAITADVRLDNRDELLAALGLADRSMSDAALVLAAYRRWATDCPSRLLGDFAFALWDAHRRALFCARDHFGVKPFCYSAGTDRFVFASEIKALLALRDASRMIDEARDCRLPRVYRFELQLHLLRRHPSSSARASAIRRVDWSCGCSAIGGPMPRICSSMATLPAQFLDLFSAAVRCRLRRADRIGAMLSGGLELVLDCLRGQIASCWQSRGVACRPSLWCPTCLLAWATGNRSKRWSNAAGLTPVTLLPTNLRHSRISMSF